MNPKDNVLNMPPAPKENAHSYVLMLIKGRLKWVQAMPAPPKDKKTYLLHSSDGTMAWIEVEDWEEVEWTPVV